MALHLFKVRWKQPQELFLPVEPLCTSPPLDPNLPVELPSTPPLLDLDSDSVMPRIQLRRTQQDKLASIFTYSRLRCQRVILGPRDILVPALPQQLYSCRFARQSNTVKA